MRVPQWDHVCTKIIFSHMMTIIAVQRQWVAEAAMKTLSYEDTSVVKSE